MCQIINEELLVYFVMQNIDIIEINDEHAYNAKLLASAMSTPQIRKRGMIDMLGIACAMNYLHAKKFRIDNRKSVYKIPLLFEEFKITDIYYGNYRIDVITLYKEKTIKIPKIHVEMDILPHFYFVVQIGSKIKEAKMVGFIDAKNIPKCSSDSRFFYPTLDMIFDIDKFALYTKKSVPTKTLLGKHIDCMGLFLKFIDNDLSTVYKKTLIQHLMNCDSCRSNFIDTMEFERLATNIRYYPELMRRCEAKNEGKKFILDLGDRDKNTIEESINDAANYKPEYSNPYAHIANMEEAKAKTVQMFDILDGTTVNKKSTIDSIFNNFPKTVDMKAFVSPKSKRKILMAFLIFIVLISFILISSKGNSDVYDDNRNIASFEEFNDEYDMDDYNNAPSDTIDPSGSIDDFIIKQPTTSNKPAYSPTISKVSFEAPESIVKKANYTKFLQLVGKNVKLNLQNDLLLVSDVPANRNIRVDINVASNGNVNSIKIADSSGSPAIDYSIKKVISETLTYMKPPAHGIVAKSADITLIIELN